MTPLAMDELNSPAGESYQRRIEASAAGRVGTPDEIAATAASLMGRDGTYITGTDLLIDGGVIAPSRPAATNSASRSLLK
jgi:NAD(P)-dependent dehydrogenase (short-subunit alcohol dehydrogenase family)